MALLRQMVCRFERHHGGVPDINPADYRLMINGLVDRELIFTLDELRRFPQAKPVLFSGMCG